MRSPLSTYGRIPARLPYTVALPHNHLSGDDKRALGAAVVHCREQAGLTTAELARRAGLTPTALHAIEKGEAEPRWGTMRRIADGLGIPFAQLTAEVERREG